MVFGPSLGTIQPLVFCMILFCRGFLLCVMAVMTDSLCRVRVPLLGLVYPQNISGGESHKESNIILCIMKYCCGGNPRKLRPQN